MVHDSQEVEEVAMGDVDEVEEERDVRIQFGAHLESEVGRTNER